MNLKSKLPTKLQKYASFGVIPKILLCGDPRELIRDGEAEFKALKLTKADLTRAEIADAIARHPALLQRPIVVKGAQAKIGRPPEAVLPLLK